MREIKFRVWDKKDNRFIEGGELVFLLYPGADRNWEVNINEQYYGNTNNNGDNDSTRFDIMQYTGLKDKNLKEIYEGDILHIPDVGLQKVYFSSGAFTVDFVTLFDLSLKECEIMGNIYENHNLINNYK